MVTAAITVISVLIFQNRPFITFTEAWIDGISFALITFIVDTAIVYPQIKKRYLKGTLPENPPASKFLSRMPQNPILFSLLFGAGFIVIVVLFNLVFFKLYQLDSMSFWSFMFYRIVYAVFFSAWMTKIIILRYIQPGAFKASVPQHGNPEVKPAFPSVSTLKEEYHSAISDFGTNMLLGVILGGTRVGMDLGLGSDETRWLFIFPQYRSQLPLSVFIYSLIVFLAMVVPVVKNIRDVKLRGELPNVPKANPFFSKLPQNPWAFGALLFIPLMVLSYIFIWGIMTIMQFEVLNFFQYFFIRLACTKLMTKGVISISILRYIQPDVAAQSN